MTTITLPRATVEQALEALKDDQYRLVEVSPNQYEYKTDLAIAALERALAQRAEPVKPYCYVYEYDGVFGLHREFYPLPYNGMKPSRTVPVYTAPLQRKPLTDEEIDAMWREAVSADGLTTAQFVRNFARAIERALEEKNCGR